MLNDLKNVVILSAFRALDTFSENMAKHEGMVRHLNQFKADYGKIKHTAIGSWEGTQEVSVVVDVQGQTSAKTYNLVELSGSYNQDAILFIDCVHNAYICTMQAVGSITVEDRQHIGRFMEVTREEAMKCQGWTMLIDADNLPHWFIVE